MTTPLATPKPPRPLNQQPPLSTDGVGKPTQIPYGISKEAYDEDFNFSVEPQYFGPFGIGADQFILREESEAAHVAQKNEAMKGMKVTGDPSKGIENLNIVATSAGEGDTVLLQKCLFKIVQTANPEIPVREVPVDMNFVLALPRSISRRLIAKIRQMSPNEERTAEQVRKDIAKLQQQLSGLEAKGSPGKDVPSSTTNTS